MFVSYSIAKKKGLNPHWAAFWGFLSGLIAVVVYASLPSQEQLMSTDTNGNKDNAIKLSTAAMICGILGFLCTIVLPLGLSILLMAPDGGRVLLTILCIGITLDLVAIILGVVSLRRNPTPASHRNAKAGLIAGSIGPILVGLLYIVGNAFGS